MNTTPAKERYGLTPVNRLDQMFGNWFENFFPSTNKLPEVFRTVNTPPINVSETDKNFCVSVELPGLEEKDISVQMMGDQLTITGERKWEEEKKGKEFHRVESQYGTFTRVVTLPENLRTENPEAVYKRGVLTITFQKVEPTPAAKIKVKAAD